MEININLNVDELTTIYNLISNRTRFIKDGPEMDNLNDYLKEIEERINALKKEH